MEGIGYHCPPFTWIRQVHTTPWPNEFAIWDVSSGSGVSGWFVVFGFQPVLFCGWELFGRLQLHLVIKSWFGWIFSNSYNQDFRIKQAFWLRFLAVHWKLLQGQPRILVCPCVGQSLSGNLCCKTRVENVQLQVYAGFCFVSPKSKDRSLFLENLASIFVPPKCPTWSPTRVIWDVVNLTDISELSKNNPCTKDTKTPKEVHCLTLLWLRFSGKITRVSDWGICGRRGSLLDPAGNN